MKEAETKTLRAGGPGHASLDRIDEILSYGTTTCYVHSGQVRCQLKRANLEVEQCLTCPLLVSHNLDAPKPAIVCCPSNIMRFDE